ncbi:hypothetical protein HK102_011563, partial [Quaeritorhiza haematococci]
PQEAQEGAHRTPGPRAGGVRRAAAHDGRLRRQRRRQGAAHRGRQAAGQGPPRRRADGLPDLRAGGDRQDLPGGVLRRLGRRPVRQAPQLPLQVRRRDRGEPGTAPLRAPRDGPGRRGDRRGRRGARQPRGWRRFGHVEPGLLDDRQPDGGHPLSRQAHLDAPHEPPRPAPHRPETPGQGRGPPPAVQPARRRRGPRDVPRHGPQEQVPDGALSPARGLVQAGIQRGRHRGHRPLGQAVRAHPGSRAGDGRGPEAGARRLRPLRPGAGEGEAGAGRRARMHVQIVPPRRVAGAVGTARRAGQTSGTHGRHPARHRGI